MWFDPKVIEDHALRLIPSFRKNYCEGFVTKSMDSFTKNLSTRIAKKVIGNEGKEQERAKKYKRKPFWQVAPDGETIERLYDPESEPLLVD